MCAPREIQISRRINAQIDQNRNYAHFLDFFFFFFLGGGGAWGGGGGIHGRGYVYLH